MNTYVWAEYTKKEENGAEEKEKKETEKLSVVCEV